MHAVKAAQVSRKLLRMAFTVISVPVDALQESVFFSAFSYPVSAKIRNLPTLHRTRFYASVHLDQIMLNTLAGI